MYVQCIYSCNDTCNYLFINYICTTIHDYVCISIDDYKRKDVCIYRHMYMTIYEYSYYHISPYICKFYNLCNLDIPFSCIPIILSTRLLSSCQFGSA